jgi:hypothetical protein
MDRRCASYNAEGVLQNYDPNCVIAYQTAAIKALSARVAKLERKLH